MAGSISVRMYRGLLGDCFLLTHRLGDKTFTALFDCGVLQCIGTVAAKPQTKAGTEHIKLVVADLKTALDEVSGGKLDLMIATHEHYDHLSGFMLAYDIWDTIPIKRLWVAWTENFNDDDANNFRKTTKDAVDTLKKAVSLKGLAVSDADKDSFEAIEDLMQFYGEEPEDAADGALGFAGKKPSGASAKSKKPLSCAGVLEWLKDKVKEPNVSYLEPGDIMKFGVNDALSAYVLGPPRAIDKLKQLDPSKGPKREVYLADPAAADALRAALAVASPATSSSGASESPFAKRFRKRPGAVFSTQALYDRDIDKSRRIDREWLGTAESLALKIDGDVNNTSLALAIEGPDDHVLLFPADAQVGNWLSWHDQTYPKAPKPNEAVKTAADLLSRVVFYKVGHHASHNATLREKGLELMTSPHLAAMIPVVGEVAREQRSKNNPDGWAMPYGDLYARLKEKTKERVLRGDGDPKAETKAFKLAGGLFDLKYDTKDQVNPRWVELTFPRPAP